MQAVRIAIIFLIVLVVCAVATVPWPGDWGELAPGEKTGRTWQSLYVFSHTATAIFDGTPLFQDENVNAPDGLAIGPHNPMFLPILFSPVTRIFGPVFSLNIASWLGLFFTFVLAFLFCREISGDFWPGVIGALAFVGASYTLTTIGSGAVGAATPILFLGAAFFTIRMLDQGTALYWLAAFFCMTLAFFDYAPIGWAALLFAAAISIAAAFDDGLRAFARGAALVIVTTATVSALEPMLGQSIASPAPASFGQISFSLFPFMPLVGAVAASFIAPPKRFVWWAIAVLFFMLTFVSGPVLGWLPGLPPLLDPSVLNLGTQIALCALTASGLRAFYEKLDRLEKDESLATRGIFTALIILIVVLCTGQSFDPEPPVVYDHLSGKGALLELPLSNNPATNARFLFYQTSHNTSVYVGSPFPTLPPTNINRGRPPHHPMVILEQLSQGQTPGVPLNKSDFSQMNFSDILLHKDALAPDAADQFSRALTAKFGPPVHTSNNSELFLRRK